MHKKGVEFVTSTIIVFVLVAIVLAISVFLIGKSTTNVSTGTTCEGQGGTCRTTGCSPGETALAFSCTNPVARCCVS